MKYYVGNVKSGRGLINSAINKLPFELHIPSYNFCGPGNSYLIFKKLKNLLIFLLFSM